jgi:hypothetical protein
MGGYAVSFDGSSNSMQRIHSIWRSILQKSQFTARLSSFLPIGWLSKQVQSKRSHRDHIASPRSNNSVA